MRAADMLRRALAATRPFSDGFVANALANTTVIVSMPRAGSNLLFEQLTRLPGCFSLGGESHIVFAAFPHLRGANASLDSGRLDAAHADPETCSAMRRCFLFLLKDPTGRPWGALPPDERPSDPIFVEKTPRNALNIPFLIDLFPEARFVFLHREPRANIGSLIDAWTVGLDTGRFVTFRDLPGWDRRGWCFLLPPGWRELRGRSLAEIAAFQWAAGSRILLDDLATLTQDRWMSVRYERLIADPAAELGRVAAFCGLDLPASSLPSAPLPISRSALTPPDPDKWRQHEAGIEGLRPVWEDAAARIASL